MARKLRAWERTRCVTCRPEDDDADDDDVGGAGGGGGGGSRAVGGGDVDGILDSSK